MHPRIWSLPSSCPLLLIRRVKCTEQTEWMKLIEYLLVKKKKKKSCSGSVQKVIQACLRSKNHYLWWTWTIQSRSYSEQAIAMQTANIYLHLDQTQVMFRISNKSNYICALFTIICLLGFTWLYFVFTAVRLSLKLLFQDVLHSSPLAFS